MDYLASNLKLLAEKEPDLCRRVNDVRPREIRFEDSFDLSYLIPPDLDLTTIDVFVSLGFGSGKELIALERYLPKRIFHLVIEPDLGLFKAALMTRDLAPVITSKRTSLAIGEEPFLATRVRLDNYYHIVTFARMHIVEYAPSVAISHSYYQEIKNRLREASYVAKRNITTLIHSAPLWQHNILINLPIIANSPGINTLFGGFKDIPAIIVAAGPSLDKNVIDLKEAKGRSLIIAVDTALRTLYLNGIQPDIVVSIDANPENFRDYEGIILDETVLVAEPVTYPEILSKFPGMIFISSYGHPLMMWIEELIGEKGYLKVGGSVATTSFDLSRKIGCNPIIFVGQDLAYTNGMTHTKGFFGRDEILKDLNKFNTIEMIERELIHKQATELVEGVDGRKVLTSPMMKGWLNWLESQVKEVKALGVECIDATEGGARIAGTKILTLKEAISSYCKNTHNIKEALSLAHSLYHPPPLDPLINELEGLIHEYRRIKEELNEGERLSRRLLWLLRDEGLSKNTNRVYERVQDLYLKVTQRPRFMKISRWSMEPLFFEMKKSKKDNRVETISRLYNTFFKEAERLVSEAHSEFKSCIEILRRESTGLEAIGG